MSKQFCIRGHDTFITGRNKHGQCVSCRNTYIKQYQKEHKKELLAQQKEYDLVHREDRKKWLKANKERIKQQKKQWDLEHKKEKAEYFREWVLANKGHRRIYIKEKRRQDINFKLAENLRSRLLCAVKSNAKKGSAIRDLGCSVEFFKYYLESKFLPGMTWDNWGFGSDKWHIDHIVPLNSFDLTDSVQFKQAVYYTNLQPLWQSDNLKKSNKI